MAIGKNAGDGIVGDHMSSAVPGCVPPGAHILVLPTLNLESGKVLQNVPLAYSTYGAPINDSRDNVILVGHSLTSNSNVHEWWGEMLGEDEAKSLDTRRYHVICFNYLGSPYGSYSPATSSSGCTDFPTVTMRDNVDAQVAGLRQLDIDGLAFAIGGSMGAMLVLELAVSYPDLVRGLIVIAGSPRHDAWQIGLNEAQRASIYADADWKEGTGQARSGLAAARMLAMLSYRTAGSYTQKFRRSNGPAVSRGAFDEKAVSDVQSYLRYQASKFVKRFDARCYVHLTHTLDSMDLWRGREWLSPNRIRIECPTLIVGLNSDQLYPLEDQRDLREMIGERAKLHIINSPHGHDSFLIEIEALNRIVRGYLDSNGF